jgi:competence protein ComEA
MTTRTRSLCALLALVAALTAFPATAGDGKVNVNQADATQLALLPRVGPAVAQRILDYRQANGPFKTLEDLMLVRGIGERTFELLKPHVTLSGETTLTEKVRVSRPAPAPAAEGAREAGSR